jgi:preprotein translocase subunit YajC
LVFTSAFAQTTGAASGSTDMFIQLVPIGLVLVIMYFLVLRPQQNRQKEHQNLVKNVRRGDTVVTTGGLIGKVVRTVDDNEIELEIAPNVKVRLLRQMISDVRSKSEPVPAKE